MFFLCNVFKDEDAGKLEDFSICDKVLPVHFENYIDNAGESIIRNTDNTGR